MVVRAIEGSRVGGATPELKERRCAARRSGEPAIGAGSDEAVPVDRVVIVGCAGSGKSTLTARLAVRTGVPHIERDALGVEGSPETLARIRDVVSGPRWIFDGHPYYAEDEVFDSADTVIILDYPRRVVLRRVLWRTLMIELTRRPIGHHRAQGLAALRDPEHPVRWAVTSHRQRHHEGLELASRLSSSHVVIHLRSPGEALRWLSSVAASPKG